MPASFQRLFALIGLVLTFFVVLEIGLEIRAVSRGWQGPWLQQLQRGFSSLTPPEIKTGNKTPVGPPACSSGSRAQLKILVLGSSHSIDPKYSPEDIWPSVMGRTLRAIGNERGMDRLSHVEIINASQIGLSLPTGYAQLKTALGRYEPDAVILYELTNTINSYSETILSGAGGPPPQADGGPGASAGSPPGRSRGGLSLLSMVGIQPRLSEFLADTTVYEQVKSKVGVRFVGLTPKEDYIGSAGEAMLRHDLEKYLSLCRAFNVRLVLTEAVTGFDYDLPMGILEDQVLSCYRYNSMLSATGWKATVTGFNQLTRHFAETNQLAFISARSALTRPEEQLRDVVHFTREGHHCMGETMAESLFRLLKGSPSDAR